MEEIQTCSAILEQGSKKGQKCWRPVSTNGYCGKHQIQAIVSKGKEEGKIKCRKHRCTTFIEQASENPYCLHCQEKKKQERQAIQRCMASIQQGNKKGISCEKAASHGDYCGKHYEYNTRLVETAAKNIRICDDGKRACKNKTQDGKLNCEDCLAKARISENASYAIRQIDTSLCLGCGTTIQQHIKGLRGKDVQQCKKCYDTQRTIEESREREERDYNRERKANIARHMNEYISSAYKRGKSFELTQEQFEELVTGICSYCGFQSETVIGIDRLDSEKGYTLPNTVSCCTDCNQMKGVRTPQQLKDIITKMYFHMLKDSTAIQKANNPEDNIGKSWLRPSEILSLVNKKKLDDYIQWCKDDERSPAFITKLEYLKATNMNYIDMLAYIKNALRTESNKQKKIINNTRQRMSKEELFGFLELNAPNKFIEHYEAAHGECKELLEEVSFLQIAWKDLSKEDKHIALTKSLTRLQNIRNRK